MRTHSSSNLGFEMGPSKNDVIGPNFFLKKNIDRVLDFVVYTKDETYLIKREVDLHIIRPVSVLSILDRFYRHFQKRKRLVYATATLSI